VSGEKVVLRLTAADLAKRPAVRTITVYDPAYKKNKTYRAVPLKDLLTAAYGGSWGENVLGEVFFDALDGYRSHARVSTLLIDGGMIAFSDVDVPDWETIPGKGMKPAPFYLVWTGPEQGKGYPWPYQVVGVKMTLLEDEYPKALPKRADPESAPVRGWAIFKRSCISCHAMSCDGGTVGPDLNEPRGITRYQRKSFLKAYIKRPSAFRRTKMPDFDELDNSELNDLMAYFDHMTKLAGTK
jgi:mono/diheme cytochrome c family protein